MKVGVPKETASGERRVALVPELVGAFASAWSEAGLGVLVWQEAEAS